MPLLRPLAYTLQKRNLPLFCKVHSHAPYPYLFTKLNFASKFPNTRSWLIACRFFYFCRHDMKCRLTDRETACAKSCIHARMVMSLTSLLLLFYSAIYAQYFVHFASVYFLCNLLKTDYLYQIGDPNSSRL